MRSASAPYVADETEYQPTVIVLSDRAFLRDCTVEFLRRHGFKYASGRASWALLNRSVARHAPDLILFDLGHQTEDPRLVMRRLHERWADATIVALGTPLQLAALAADADGWIDMSETADRVSDFAAAVARPHHGRLSFPAPPKVQRQIGIWQSLTRRQRQVLGLLGCGVDNHRLARALGISERAVKAHVSALLEMFKADSRTELALIASHAGLHCPNGGLPFQA